MTTTPQWREEYDRRFGPYLSNAAVCMTIHNWGEFEGDMTIPAFIETQIAQAERRGAEEMKKKIKERIKHIETLGKGYGINDKRIGELKWVLKTFTNPL